MYSSNSSLAPVSTVAAAQKIADNTGGFGTLVNSDYFGGAVAGVDDLDNDGVEDIVVGAYLDDTGGTNRGAAYVLLLKTDGTVKFAQKIAHNTGGFGALADNDYFGSALAGIGDLDGDSVKDLVVGAYLDDTGGTNRGAAYVLFMKADGTVKSAQKIAHNTGGFGTLVNNDYFGGAVAGIGDLDGDGVEDIAVGAHLDDGGGTNRGAVYVLLLKTDGTVKSAQKIAHDTGGFGSLADNDNFGSSVAGVGDLDNDGVLDILVGARGNDTGGNNRGAAYVLLMNTNGTVKSAWKIGHNSGGFGTLINGDGFGSAVAAVGDLNNDGFPDWVVGARGNDTGGSNRGASYILFGGSGKTSPTTANASITLQEDTLHTFSRADFPFTDPDPGNQLQRLRITQLVTAGQLFLDTNDNNQQDGGEAIITNQDMAVGSLNQLKFAPAPNENGNNYATFQFQVSDGIFFSPPGATMTLNVTPVNDAPALTGEAALLPDGFGNSPYPISKSHLLAGFTDEDNDPLSVINLLVNGILLLPDSNGDYSFNPPANSKGRFNVTYAVSDGTTSTPATLSFNLNAAETVPERTGSATLSVSSGYYLRLTGASDPRYAQLSLLSQQPQTHPVEFGLFKVDDAEGNINGLSPGDRGYAAVALARAQTIFSTLGDPDFSSLSLPRFLLLEPETSYGLLAIHKGTLDAWSRQPTGILSFGSFPGNVQGNRPLTSIYLEDEDTYVLNWDLNGDQVFGDFRIKVGLASHHKPAMESHLQGGLESEVLDLRHLSGEVKLELQVYREAKNTNLLGFYRVENTRGTVLDEFGNALNPSDEGYIRAAVRQWAWQPVISPTNRGILSATVSVTGGQILAPFMITNGKLEQLLDADSTNDPAVFFPFLAANPSQVDHVRLLGDNGFGFEDWIGGGDLDYDDLIVQVKVQVS